MRDGFACLRHHTVIGCHDQNDNIRTLRTTCPHSGEGGVTGGVEKRDLLFLVFDLISTDVLGDAAGLTTGDIGMPDGIQQGVLP
jgi:hypothetical protein